MPNETSNPLDAAWQSQPDATPAPVFPNGNPLDAQWTPAPPKVAQSNPLNEAWDRPAPVPMAQAPAQTAPLIPSDASISANAPSIWDRITNIFTAGNPNYSSRTASNPKFGQNQLISPEAAATPAEQSAHPVATGIGELAGGLSSPESALAIAATGGLGELPGAARLVPKLISAGFGINAIVNAYNSSPDIRQAFASGNTSEAERLLTHAVGNTVLGVAAMGHAALGKGRPGITDATDTADVVEAPEPQPEVKTIPAPPFSPIAEVVNDPAKVPDVRLTESNAAKLQLTKDETIQPPTETTNRVVQDSFVPVVSESEVLNAAVQRMIDTDKTLQKIGVDPERIETRADVAKMLNDASEHIGGNLDPRVGTVIGFDAQKELASDLGMSVTDLLQRTGGTAFSAEQSLAARALLKASTTDVMNKARLAATGDETQMDAFTKALAQNRAIQDQVQSVAAEAGRALGSFNIKEPDLPETRIVDALSQLSEDAQKKAAELLAKTDTSNNKAANNFIAQITPSTVPDKIFEYYRNALLSGGSVFSKSISEATMLALTGLQKGVAGAISSVWDPDVQTVGDGGEVIGDSTRQFPSEAYFWGKGVVRGLSKFKDVLTGEFNLEDSPDFERTNVKAIKNPILGPIVRFPSDVLSRLTNGVFMLNYFGELYSQAARIALREGLTGNEFQARMDFLLANPTDDLRDAAQAMGEKNTFQQDLGKFGTSLQNVVKNDPTGLAKYIFPFTKVPMNLIKQGVYWSPVSVFKGVATGDNNALAAGTIGTALAVGIATAVLEGKISGGGPVAWKPNQALQATGWQPYSLKVGDHWVSYKKLTPVSLAMSLVADAVHSIHAGDDPEVSQSHADAAVAHIVRNVRDFPFLQGLSSVMEMIEDTSGRRANNFIDRSIAAFIPSVVADAAKSIDPVVRHPQGLIETLESRLPGQTQKVPPSLGPDGEPLTRPRNAAGGLSPIPITTVKHDDAFDELSRLGLSGVQPPKLIPMKKLVNGKAHEIPDSAPTAQQALEIQRQESAKFYQAFNRAIGHPKWESLSDSGKAQVVSDLKKKIAETRLHRLRQLQAAQ